MECTTVNSSSLSCTWSTPVLINHNITSYQLSYRLADGFDYYDDYGETLGSFDLGPDVLQQSINDLLPYGGYQVELKTTSSILTVTSGSADSSTGTPVSSYEGQLTGSTSTVNITHSQGSDNNVMLLLLVHIVPTVPVEEVSIAILSPNSTKTTWKPPARREWKGKIETYLIQVQRHSYDNESNETVYNVRPQHNDPDPSLAREPLMFESYVINLEENFEYTFSISIVNAAGKGMQFNSSIIKMPQSGKI